MQVTMENIGGIRVPKVQTPTGWQSFTFYGSTAWNNLPTALCDNNLSLQKFK